MKALYGPEVPLTAQLRPRKGEFLRRFQSDGYYLIDASPTPLGSRTPEQAIREGPPDLLESVRHLATATTKIVLIKKAVYEIAGPFLIAHGIDIANTEMLNFPGSGQQGEFHRKFAKLLPTLR
jgi:hypothetical protein